MNKKRGFPGAASTKCEYLFEWVHLPSLEIMLLFLEKKNVYNVAMLNVHSLVHFYFWHTTQQIFSVHWFFFFATLSIYILNSSSDYFAILIFLAIPGVIFI